MHRIWIRATPNLTYIVPIETDASPNTIVKEEWEWYGPIEEQDLSCAATGAFMRLGIRRIRTVATREPIPFFGDRAFGIFQFLISLPYMH